MTGASKDLNELATALNAAQAAFPSVEPDGSGQVGQNRNYKYATLAHILGTVRPTLTANGLAVTQTCEPGDGNTIRLTTTLLHKSGQWISGTASITLANNTPQGYGSAMTYARRYSLSAILGIASEDDDDGHEGSQTRRRTNAPASPVQPQQRPQAPQQAQPAAQTSTVPFKDMTPTTATPESWRWLWAQMKDLGLKTEREVKELLTINSFHDDMPDQTFERIVGFCRVQLDKARLAAIRTAQ